MDLRRSVLWVVFTMSMIFLYNSWLRYNGETDLFGTPPAHPAHTASAAAPAVPQAVSSAAVPPGTAATAPTTATTSQPAAQLVTIRTDLMEVKISSRGGNLVYAKLLKYESRTEPGKHVVLFDDTANNKYMAQSGLIGGDFPNHETEMTVLPGPRDLGTGKTLQVTLVSPDLGGVRLQRTYTFTRDSYVVNVQNTITNTGTAPVSPQLYLQIVRDGNTPPGDESHFYHTYTGPAYYDNANKFQKFEFKDLKVNETPKKADSGWVAMIQHYFVSAWVPQPYDGPRDLYARKLGDNLYAVGVIQPLPQIAPGKSITTDAKLFVGPELESTLAALAPGLELVKDYGWVTLLAKPIFWLLEVIHKVVQNWGWSIIVLTLLIKLAFFPLTAASYKSMARMKAVAPRINALREQYKDDQVKMNQAMVELYRKEKINPLGGCLPIVIQIPVFIALYWVLLSSVELRGAPWILWIHDLSAKDPYYILPAIMTATSFLQVKLNPTPPDPMQAKLMWIMPAAFSIMFFFFPAGLVLYWLTNNTTSIAQQWFINKKMGVAVLADAPAK
ncbi:membrane protein insertase YidC [Thiomonas sp.]|jgi:YidC/Oxa1 family membrane protein insertase|uniref:membrane protein insertase YidC n=1 Tax=Thiomonas sp. TaxID=2047785 RepID=UPI002609A4F9|nr:membrane protein insertase YidC [Thiomonas sp.]